MSYQHTLYWRQVSRHSNCVDNFLNCKEMLENEFLRIIRGLSQLLIVSELYVSELTGISDEWNVLG